MLSGASRKVGMNAAHPRVRRHKGERSWRQDEPHRRLSVPAQHTTQAGSGVQLLDLSAPSGRGVKGDGPDPDPLHPQLLPMYCEPLEIQSAPLPSKPQGWRPFPTKPAQSLLGDSSHLLGGKDALPIDEQRGLCLFAPGPHLTNTVSPARCRDKISKASGLAGCPYPLRSQLSLRSQQLQGVTTSRGQTHKHTRSPAATCSSSWAQQCW